jgi:PST family polysaccharide transporter
MEGKAVSGVRWTMLTYGASKVVTLGATVVLARLLVPADFGVVILAFVAINVVGSFGDLGLGAALVVRTDLDRRGLGTVLTLLLASGIVLAVLLVVGAGPLSHGLHEPRLRPVLIGLAPLTVLGSLNWFYQWLLQRELEFRDRFFGFLAQTVTYAVVAIVAAATGAGVWSIVAGHLAGQLAMAAVYMNVAPTVRPGFDRGLAADVLRTSRGFLLQTTAMLLQQNADYLAVGRTLGSAPLGFYSMAFRLSELPHLAVADPVATVTFPGFSRMQARGEPVDDHYLQVLQLVALVTSPIGALLSATADPFTRLVYGPRWVPMIGTLAVLAVWGAVKSVQATVEWMLNSLGGAGAAGVLAVVLLAVQAPALFVAAHLGGTVAVGQVLLAALVLSVVLLVACLRRRAGLGFAAHGRVLWPVVLAAGAGWIVARLIADGLGQPPVPALVASLGAGALAYAVVVSACAPGILPRAARLALRAVKGGGLPGAVAVTAEDASTAGETGPPRIL